MNVSSGHPRTPPHNADGLALVAGLRHQGEEPSSRHRVGPWSPVNPVEVVPAIVGGDTVSGSLQDNRSSPAGRDPDGRLQSFEDHSLLALAGEGVPVLLSTDAQAVMNTTMREEYIRATIVLDTFRGNPTQGETGRGKMPVTRDAYLVAHPGIDPASAQPPFELSYDELPDAMKRNIDTAFERMVSDASQRRADVTTGDAVDRRRNGDRP